MKQLIVASLILLFSSEMYSQANNPRVSPIHAGTFSNGRLTYVVGKIYTLSPPLGKQSEETGQEFINIKVYPNPVTNVLNIETFDKSEVKVITIFDVMGKLMYSGDLENGKVDVTFLKQGTYIIKLDNDNSKTFKIIKN